MEALQQEPFSIMQIQICDKADANFPAKVSGVNVITLYDTGTNMSCISLAWNVKLKDPPSLKMIAAMSEHSATSHDLCPIGLACCEVTIGKSQFKHTFTVCKKLKKNLLLVLICNSYIV